MAEKDPNHPGEIVNEFTPTNEPEPSPDPSLQHSEDQPADPAKKEAGSSGKDQDSGGDQADS